MKDNLKHALIVVTVLVVCFAISLLLYEALILDGHHHHDGMIMVTATVTPIDNAEYADGIIYQVNASEVGKIKLDAKVIDTDGKPMKNAIVEVTGPGFSMKTNTTNSKGIAGFELSFELTSSAGDFITIKASRSTSELGGVATYQLPVHPK